MGRRSSGAASGPAQLLLEPPPARPLHPCLSCFDFRVALCRRRRTDSAHSRFSSWAVWAALLLLGAALVYLYRRAPQAASEEAGAEESRRDSEAELQLLHEQPSPAFCAQPPPLVCAHGGDTSAAPPNTAAAFAAALAGGARCVEVDVARTKDGQLVVLHARELAHLLQLAGRWTPPKQHGRGKHPAQPLPQVGGVLAIGRGRGWGGVGG